MATIKDVARVSGVSIATVSQVLSNGRRPVSPTTRERVVRAAQQLDYRPNALARALLSKRLNTVGLVLLHGRLSSQAGAFVTSLLDGVLSVNTRREQATTLYTISRWEDATAHVSRICDRRCDGVILVAPPAGCVLPEALSQAGLPYVLASGRTAGTQAASVDIDNAAAAAGMTEYLLRLGHRRIAFVSPQQERLFPSIQERHQGYRRTMGIWGAGGAVPIDLSLEDTLGAARSGPTAFFCADDADALALIGRLPQQGLRVPEDVSVVGFGDIPGAALSRPALTTVHRPADRIGERAAEMLLDLIEGLGLPERQETVATEMAIRQSATAPGG